MQASQIPSKFQIPFANAAGSGYVRAIPVASQQGITPGAASLTDGFPPLCFVPVGSGGIPPFGADMNGILNEITQWLQWSNAGGTVPYDGTFASAIGGYPAGALLLSQTSGVDFWLCTTDNNSSNPDIGGAGWKGLSITPGTAIPQFEGTGSAGAALKFSREDHRHPNDYCGVSTGSANAQVITTPNGLTSLTDGTTLSFDIGFTNTGAATLQAGSLGTLPVLRSSIAGPVALTGGELVAGNPARVMVNGGNFLLLSAAAGTAASQNTSRNTGKVVALTGTVVNGNVPIFDTTDGTVKDSGVSPGSLLTSADGLAYQLGILF